MAKVDRAPATEQSANLADLFTKGDSNIERKRTDNLFKQLDERSLTDEEQGIIQQRIELQRKLLVEYEKRDKKRKVQEILDICPDITEAAAERALELCNDREDEAASKLASEFGFKRRVMVETGSAMPCLVQDQNKRNLGVPSRPSAPARIGPMPKLVSPSKVESGVFVGRFSSRLGPYQKAGYKAGSGAGTSAATAAAPAKGAKGGRGGGSSKRATRSSKRRPDTTPEPDTAAGAGSDSADEAEGEGEFLQQLDCPNGTAEAEEQLEEEEACPADIPAAADAELGAAAAPVAGASPAAALTAGQAGPAITPEPGSQPVQEYQLVMETPNGTVVPVPESEAKRIQAELERATGEQAGSEGQQQQQPQQQEGEPVAQTTPHVQPEQQQPQQKKGRGSKGKQEASRCRSPTPPPAEGKPEIPRGARMQAITISRRSFGDGLMQLQNLAQKQVELVLMALEEIDAAKAEQLRTAYEVVMAAAAADVDLAVQEDASSRQQQQQYQQQYQLQYQQVYGQQTAQQAQQTTPAPQQQQAQQRRSLSVSKRAAALRQQQAEAAASPPAAEAPAAPSPAPEPAQAPAAAPAEAAAGPVDVEAAMQTLQMLSDQLMEKADQQQEQQQEQVVASVEAITAVAMDVDAAPAAAVPEQQPAAAAEPAAAQQQQEQQLPAQEAPQQEQPPQEQPAQQQEQQQEMDEEATVTADAEDAEPPASTAKTRGRNGKRFADAADADDMSDDDMQERRSSKRGRAAARKSAAAVAALVAAEARGEGVEEKGGASSSGGEGSDGEDRGEGSSEEDEAAERQEKPARKAKSNALPRANVAAMAPPPVAAAAAPAGQHSRAISAKGTTVRGRVRQKSSKRAELLEAGELNPAPGWYNAGYIFPMGFKSRLLFRSSVDLDALCIHECSILGEEGELWPAPTFVVTALDRPDEPLVGKSCTACWSAVLKRINAVIESRRKAGEDLPPPPKTAIAGPEYFGLLQPEILPAIEDLDQDRLCTEYWVGKADREAAAAGLPVAPREILRKPLAIGGRGGGAKKRGRGRGGEDDDEEEEGYKGNRWSAISRHDRYKKRCADNGDEATKEESDNPLPGFIDPITLEPVVRPAISPYGHVMGYATWRAVLAEQQRCPFTKQPLSWEQLAVLTANNIDKYRDRIVQQ